MWGDTQAFNPFTREVWMIVHAIGLVALLISAVTLLLVAVQGWIRCREIEAVRRDIKQLDDQYLSHISKIKHRNRKAATGGQLEK